MKNKLEIIKISLLMVISLCLVVLVFRELGEKTQYVYVRGGSLDADVRGSVSVDNTVDVNLYKINNQRNVFFNNPRRGEEEKYYVIPVTIE